jgi:hypothetical protein
MHACMQVRLTPPLPLSFHSGVGAVVWKLGSDELLLSLRR